MGIINNSPWLLELLDSSATYHQYHAFQNGIRHNHLLEGAVAIARIGGSKEYVEKFLSFVDKRYAKYTGAEDDEEQLLERDIIQTERLEDYRGKNQAFYKMLAMYTKLYETKFEKDINKLVQDVCPAIIDGPLYSSFHGIIQLAYGLISGCDQAALEGVTFMDQQYSPVFPDDSTNTKRQELNGFGHGKRDVFDILEDLSNNPTLQEKIKLDHKKGFEIRKASHFYGTYGWAVLKYHSDYFMELTNSIALPDWFAVEEKDTNQLMKLMGWVMDVSTQIFVESKATNGLFLLHGITGSWSYSKVLPLLDYETGLRAVRSMLCSLLMTYISQDAPALAKKPEEHNDDTVTQDAWDKLFESVLESQEFYEFHVYKVIQCVYERWLEQPDSSYSTSFFQKYYMAAAKVVSTNDYCAAGNIPVVQPNKMK